MSRTHRKGIGGRNNLARAAVDEGESVTDPRELEIESNFLGLALSPASFLLSTEAHDHSFSLTEIQVKFTVCARQCLSLFLISLSPLSSPCSALVRSLSLSLFLYHFLSSVVQCSISALSGAYARSIIPSAAISFVRRDSDKRGRGELLCQCQWHRSCERKISMVSEYQFRRAHGSLNRIPLP